MAVPQCNHINGYHNRCSNDAQFRCTGPYCGNKVYCVEHSRMIDSRYICDSCLKEIERARREAERERVEAERDRREAARMLGQGMILARELALAEARQNSKIWYPRIMFVLSLIMFFPALLILTLNQPSDSTPPIQTNPPLAILGILGGILLFISWFCVIGFAIKREQGGWVAGLIFFNFFAAILYLLLDPIG